MSPMKGLAVGGMAAAVIGLLAGCTMPPNDGFTQTRADAMPYAQAHALCHERGMGAAAGGPGESATRLNLYLSCMAAMGWEDRRQL